MDCIFLLMFLPYSRSDVFLSLENEVNFFMLFTHNGILFSVEKEGSPTICNNKDEPGEYYIK